MKTKQLLVKMIEDTLKLATLLVLIINLVVVLIAVFDPNNDGEASVGRFDVDSFNEGWILNAPDGWKTVELPQDIAGYAGEKLELSNTLPSSLEDGMSLMTRASVEDMFIYIDGELREEYSSDTLRGMDYYIPSAFIVTELNSADSGKEIKIVINVKAQAILNEVSIGNGNNVWFPVMYDGLPLALIAISVLVLGFLLECAVFVLSKKFNLQAAWYLGLLMIDVAVWAIGESNLRQLIFSRPSLTQYFSYFLMELIPVFACMYFDEVQHRKYHHRYLIAETVALGIIGVNLVLHALGIASLYLTMFAAQLWGALCAVLAIVGIVADIVKKEIREYIITAIGMGCFILMSLTELSSFYISGFHIFGSFICIGLILLMVATVMQAIYDEVRKVDAREKQHLSMTIRTLETIAGSIDAKDEYTGGHSERVGSYVERLAREMAAEYDFSEEDILRARYVGLVHDIGKIGVSDSVLNKAGKLSDEEFQLMKKHAEIGYELMSAIGDEVEGMLDGIRYHHERFDGRGYPDGLSGTDIPLIARMLALADSYDAMTSNRVYRKRLTDEEVKNELLRCAGTQFDPALTQLFVRLLERGELKAATMDGAAVDESGSVRSSALLEKRLQKDLLDKKEVKKPSHIRMLCYIMKLMEKKGKDYMVFFMSAPEKECDLFDRLIAELGKDVGRQDLVFGYSVHTELVILYDRNEEETKAFLEKISAACPGIQISELEG